MNLKRKKTNKQNKENEEVGCFLFLKMLKAPLSELSRGKGEKRGSYVEVVYEDKVSNKLSLNKY